MCRATMLPDQRFDEIVAQHIKVPQRAHLVGAHEARVADHISGENCGETAFHPYLPVAETKREGPRNLCAVEVPNVRAWQPVRPMRVDGGLCSCPMRYPNFLRHQNSPRIRRF